MADLVETQNFDAGIYQLETTDPVEGGPGGIDNRQAQQLANRTAWLKLQQEQHAAAVDPHPQYMTAAESNAAIADAVAAVVASSPAALDTLNELAAALGNDQNFATTINNAIAARMQWSVVDGIIQAAGITPDHAVLTQLLTALRSSGVFQTAAQFDVTTKVATNEFVKRALGSFSGTRELAVNTVLALTDVGKVIYSTGATLLTLPLIATAGIGESVYFINLSATPVTIAGQGADTVITIGTAGSVVLNLGESILLTKSSGAWRVSGGTVLDRNSAAFGASKAASGYQKLPSGLIIQWGSFTTSSSADTPISFPIAFPNVTVVVNATCYNGTGSGNYTLSFGVPTTSSIPVGTYVGSTGVRIVQAIMWIAVGY